MLSLLSEMQGGDEDVYDVLNALEEDAAGETQADG
jgi:hypothetical protein